MWGSGDERSSVGFSPAGFINLVPATAPHFLMLSVLVRKSCSFSKSLAMHTARIKIGIDNYNLTL